MKEKLIYHICTSTSWEAQSSEPTYTHASLALESFIQCSEEHQIEGVLERYFKGQNDLVILTINIELLTAQLQYDTAPNGEMFPHIYGSIEKEAITAVHLIRE